VTIENLLPSLKYIGIGGLILLGVVLLLWLGLVATVLFGTKGIPKAISNFFGEIGDGDLEHVYGLMSPTYRDRHSIKDLQKLIQTHKLKTYKNLNLAIPKKSSTTNAYIIEVTVILRSGKEIPFLINLVKSSKQWLVDDLMVQKPSKT
jgi:hypothetical protein